MAYIPPIKGKFLKKQDKPIIPDLAGSVFGVAKFFNELEIIKKDFTKTIDQKIDEVSKNIAEFEKAIETTSTLTEDTKREIIRFREEAIKAIRDIKVGPAGKDGKDAEPVDEKKIIQSILDQIPSPEPIDEKGIARKVLKMLPEDKPSLKIIQEKFETDPMSVIEKIMSLPEDKFKIKSTQVDGLQQTIDAFRSQLSRGYLHGGGISKVSHDATLSGDGTPQNPLSALGVSGYNKTFIVGDWILNGVNYELTVTHSLNSSYPIIETRDSTTETVYVNHLTVVDANNIKLSVPTIPDLRFAGSVAINSS